VLKAMTALRTRESTTIFSIWARWMLFTLICPSCQARSRTVVKVRPGRTPWRIFTLFGSIYVVHLEFKFIGLFFNDFLRKLIFYDSSAFHDFFFKLNIYYYLSMFVCLLFTEMSNDGLFALFFCFTYADYNSGLRKKEII